MSDNTDKKQNTDWGKKWFESNKIFIPEDKPDAKEYMHEYLGIPIAATRYAFESLFNKRGNSA